MAEVNTAKPKGTLFQSLVLKSRARAEIFWYAVLTSYPDTFSSSNFSYVLLLL